MKEIKTYRCEVDLYRNGAIFRSPSDRLYDRGNTGVYYVGAKSPKEAKEILQKHIKFGSICVPTGHWQYVPEQYQNLAYKEVQKFESPYKIVDKEENFESNSLESPEL